MDDQAWQLLLGELKGIRRGIDLINGRVRRNERWRYLLTGGLIVLFGLFGWKVPF